MSQNNKNSTEALLADIAEFSHLQFAELYYKLNKEEYIFSDKTGWYYYDEFNILINNRKEPSNLLNNVVIFLSKYIKEEMMKLSFEQANYKENHNKLFLTYKKVSQATYSSGIIKFLPSLYLDKEIDDKIDAKKELFAFSDKVFNIKKGIYRDIRKNDYILRNTKYPAPQITNNYKLIDKLLFSIFEDKEIVDYFLLITALSLFTNKYEKLYILTGSGRNGKGVLSTLINKALGDYYLTGSNDLLTTKDELKNETLAKAKNIKYLAISEPAEDGEREPKFNLTMVKKLTGRDKISTRGMYQSSFEYIPDFTMFISCNNQPKVPETNEAIRNRFRFIHFPFTFVDKPKLPSERKIDVDLKDRIDNETEYRDTLICYLLFLVSQDYDKIKIREPKKCTEFKQSYFNDNNDVGNFLEKYFDITNDKNDRIGASSIFDLYTSDKEFSNMSITKFGKELTNNKIAKIKDGSIYYVGLTRKKEKVEFVEDSKKSSLDL